MNFYKITNEGENHNDLQYKTGLNIDILPWNPTGDCEPGGIYFSREDILAFMEYGPWIRQVTIPEGVEVYENPRKPKKWKAHEVMLGERRRMDVSVIKGLLEEGADVHAQNDRALRWSSKNGHLEIVKLLIRHGAYIHAADDWAFIWASTRGHLEIVKLLIKHGADIHVHSNYALRRASENGQLETVKFLVERGADIHAENNHALVMANDNRHSETVKFLLECGAKGINYY